MSTQIQLHVRTEEMTDEMLRSEGHLDGGIAGVMGQLMNGPDYFEELNDLMRESDSHIVGNSLDDGPSDIADIFEGVTEVTSRVVEQAQVIAEDSEDLNGEVVEWLYDNKGEEVFAVHW